MAYPKLRPAMPHPVRPRAPETTRSVPPETKATGDLREARKRAALAEVEREFAGEAA
jgi:hypothetical protein